MWPDNLLTYVFLFIKTDCLSVFTIYSNVYMVYPGHIAEEKVNTFKISDAGNGLPTFFLEPVHSE